MSGVGVLGDLGGSDIMRFLGDLRVQHHVEFEVAVVVVCLRCCLVEALPPVGGRVLGGVQDVVFDLRRRISRFRHNGTVWVGKKSRSWYS